MPAKQSVHDHAGNLLPTQVDGRVCVLPATTRLNIEGGVLPKEKRAIRVRNIRVDTVVLAATVCAARFKVAPAAEQQPRARSLGWAGRLPRLQETCTRTVCVVHL